MKTFQSLIFIVIVCWITIPESQAQQYLYLKKTGTSKMKRYTIGDSILINFSAEEPLFLGGTIRNIRRDLLTLNDQQYNLSDVVQVRAYSRELVLVSNAMKWGSLIYLGLMIANSHTDAGPIIKTGPAVAAATVFGGSFIMKRTARKTYDLTKQWRLEIIDFDTFENDDDTQP